MTAALCGERRGICPRFDALGTGSAQSLPRLPPSRGKLPSAGPIACAEGLPALSAEPVFTDRDALIDGNSVARIADAVSERMFLVIREAVEKRLRHQEELLERLTEQLERKPFVRSSPPLAPVERHEPLPTVVEEAVSPPLHLGFGEGPGCADEKLERKASETKMDVVKSTVTSRHLKRVMTEHELPMRSSVTFAGKINQTQQFAWRSFRRLKEPKRSGMLNDVVSHVYFSITVTVVVLINAIFAAIKVDFEIAYLDADLPKYLNVAEPLFVTFFFCELGLQLAVHRWFFFVNDDWKWNLLDFGLVVMALFDLAFQQLIEAENNFTFMRSLRLLRVFRAFRVFRMMRFCRELRMMLSSIVGTFRSLLWCIVLLMFILYLFAMIFVQGLTMYVKESGFTEDAEEYHRITHAFGSTSTAIVSLFMAGTGGQDWEAFYQLLFTASSLYAILFILYICFFMFAVVNVLTGIIVEGVAELGRQDEEGMLREFRKTKSENVEGVRRLYKELDADGSGTISFEEFESQIDNEVLQAYFAAVQIDVKDAEIFFETLMETSGVEEVEIDQFVGAVERMKGSATSVDMQNLLFQTRQLRVLHQDDAAKSLAFERRCCDKLDTLSDMVANVCRAVYADTSLAPLVQMQADGAG